MKVLLKKSLVFALVCSMVFSTTSFSVLADGINNESVEENESAEESENAEDEGNVGASSASPEEVEPEDESVDANESVGASSASPDKETDANSVSPEENSVDDDNIESDEDNVGASSASPEEIEPEDESVDANESVGASSASPDDETEDTSSTSPEENESEDVEPEEHKKSSDGLYGNASDPLLYIYYADSNYTPADKNGHVQGLQVRPEVFAAYVSNPNNPYNQFYETLQAVTGVWLPTTMTFKGFHFVSDQIIPDNYMEQYEIFEGFKQSYTHDTSVDYANAADIVWDGTHDLVLYTVYESISFKVMYFDENDTVQTETFDTNNDGNDLENFLQSINQTVIEGKTFKGYKQLTTEDEISGYTGEATSDDSYPDMEVLASFDTWKQDPSASVTWAAFYNITRYFNVIYIEDNAHFVSKTNSYKIYTTSNSSSNFTGDNGDIAKLYNKGLDNFNDNFFRTVGIEEVSSFTRQSELAALVASPSTCLGTSGSYDITLLDDKFNEWYNNGYPTKNVCWVVKYAGAYRWYAASTNQYGEGPSNVDNVSNVRRQFFDLTYGDYAFADYNEFYSYTQGTWIPKRKSFKGLKIVPYTDILTANPTDIRKYYLQNYYFNEDAVNDTDLKTPAELEQIYKAWTESNDDIYNSYAAFIVYETAPKELQSIGFGTYPTKMTYFEGETFNPAALVLTLVFKNGYPNESLAYAGNEDKITFELPSGDDALTTALARDGNNSTVAITVKYGGCSNTFNITVNEVPKVIDSISIATPPQTTYIEGQTFNPANLVIKVKYEDNSEENITYNNTTQNNFTFTLPSGDDALTTQLTTGNPIVTVGYMGKTTPLALTVAAKQVTGINITNEPKKAYEQGEKFDPSGLIINVTYDNGTDEDVDYNDHKGDFSFEIDGNPVTVNTVLNTAGNYDVKVKYKGQEASYQINVRAIERLQPVNNGTTTYIEGQTFNPAGLSFKVIYTNGDEETIEYNNTPTGITFNPSITTPLKTTDTEVTVSYKGFSYDITLNVSEDTRKVETVEITTEQDKKEYEQGQSFDGTGMVIHVIYDDSSDAYIPYNTDFSFEPSVLNTVGDEIEVYVTYKGETSSNSVKVKVKKKTSKPSNPSNSGSSSSSSDSDSDEPSDPTKGPMGDLTKNPVKNYTPVKPVENTIPLNKLLIDPALVAQVKASSDNDSTAYANARDVDNNTGYGEWLRVGKSSVWYFLTSDFNQGLNNEPLGFLRSGWFNLGWDGLDKWYYFDGEGVMKMGWYSENGKTYYLETDINYNWYGEAVTGTRVIDGKTYHFGEDYALIQ